MFPYIYTIFAQNRDDSASEKVILDLIGGKPSKPRALFVHKKWDFAYGWNFNQPIVKKMSLNFRV